MNKTTRFIAGAAAAAALAGGAAGAVAFAGGTDAEQAVLADAAERLGVIEDELRSALSAAERAQLDRAVQDGRLTQEQADEIREHQQESGSVLGLGHGGPPPGGPGFEHGPGPIEDVAKALGITPEQLFERLHDGETLAEIAEAEGKTIAELKEAAGADIVEHLQRFGERPDFGRHGPPPGFGHGRP